MRGNFFKYVPQCLLLFHGNYRPRLANADEAMRRRMRLLPFRFKPTVIDKELLDKFIAELGGILVWAIEGAVLWCRHGLQAPPIITQATDRYFESEKMMAAWVDERCERGKKDLTSYTRDLYLDYAAWANRQQRICPVRAALCRNPRNAAGWELRLASSGDPAPWVLHDRIAPAQ